MKNSENTIKQNTLLPKKSVIYLKTGNYSKEELCKIIESASHPKQREEEIISNGETSLESIKSEQKREEIKLYREFYNGIRILEEELKIANNTFVNIFHTTLYDLNDIFYFRDKEKCLWIKTLDSYAVFFDEKGIPRFVLPIILLSNGVIISTISPLYYRDLKKNISNEKLKEILSRKENLLIEINNSKILSFKEVIEKYF